ncbi:NAD(P)/FAD-dependent oxidoreductase [Intestinibacter sp.]
MKYIVLGASASGINGARQIRRHDENAEIVLISKDENIYSRCILHHYLEGIRNVKQLEFVEDNFIENNKIRWIKGVEATSLDTENKIVHLSNGDKESFDKLLISTGSSSFFPPIENLNTAKNVVGLRNLSDCEVILSKLDEVKNIVILGGGLVAIDAASGLMHKGKNIYLVERSDRMLQKQLDKKAAKTYIDAFEKEGVTQFYNSGVTKLNVDENGYVKSVETPDKGEIPCDLFICAAGVRSNVKFLEGSGVELDRFGLIIDEHGKTNIDYIYGAGDVTGRSPIWPAAVKQGIIAADNMCGKDTVMTDFFASKSTMNFLGIPTMSLGINEPEDDTYTVEILEDNKGNYKKIIHKDGKIYGAIIQGDLSYAGILTQLIREKIDVSKVKKSIFDIDYSDFFHIQDNFEFTY